MALAYSASAGSNSRVRRPASWCAAWMRLRVSATCGDEVSTGLRWAFCTSIKVTGVNAVTVAERGAPVTRDISPKTSPGASRHLCYHNSLV